MAREDRSGEAGSPGGQAASQGPRSRVQQPEGSSSSTPSQRDLRSPLFVAEQSDRYERQRLIREYEDEHSCRLIYMSDVIFPESVAYLEELIWDASPAEDLHMMLDSPGGDGETAVRLVRSAQARCNELSVIVPDQAKSAGTILAMGAHNILMGPTSDLGPVDPQFQVGDRGNLVAAKDIIASVAAAESAIAKNPDSYPLHAALLSDVSALMVQQARSAIDRTADLVLEALLACPGRTEGEAKDLLEKIKKPLIDLPKNHGAVVNAELAKSCGLPVSNLDPQSNHWHQIWRLYAKYFVLKKPIYEGRLSSRIPDWAS